MKRASLLIVSLVCIAGGILLFMSASGGPTSEAKQFYDEYYDENGNLITTTKNDSAGNRLYVMRTTKLMDSVYSTNEMDAATLGDSTGPAAWGNVSAEIVVLVTDKIRNKKTKDSLVRQNVIRIANKELLMEMYSAIRDDGTGGETDTLNSKEYGAIITGKWKLGKIKEGLKGTLCGKGASVELINSGIGEFHSHPSGANSRCNFMQGPSLYDQGRVEDRTGYVFAMRDKRIYIYTNQGTLAVLPFTFFGYTDKNRRAISSL